MSKLKELIGEENDLQHVENMDLTYLPTEAQEHNQKLELPTVKKK